MLAYTKRDGYGRGSAIATVYAKPADARGRAELRRAKRMLGVGSRWPTGADGRKRRSAQVATGARQWPTYRGGREEEQWGGMTSDDV